MTALKPPFLGRSITELNTNIQKGVFPNINSKFSILLNELVHKILQVNPYNRPNISQILSSPIFSGIEVTSNEVIQDNRALIDTIKVFLTIC